MHCAEKYSLDCGVESNPPHIELSFFPQPCEKYIILENSSRAPAAKYGHVEELMAYINPFLKKHGIMAVQMKLNRTDAKIPNCKTYENLSFPQINYLVKNSLLVMSNDYFLPAIAGVLNKKTISLHGIFPKESNAPAWGTAPHINLQAEKDIFLLKEDATANYINRIFPETIADELLKALGIKSNIGQITPLYCGPQFINKTIEVVPDFEVTSSTIHNETINVRADYHFNERNIVNLIAGNKVNLITKKLISDKYLSSNNIKENIVQINYEVNPTTTQQHVDSLLPLGCEINLFSKSERDIQRIRLNLIDHEIELEKPKEKKDLDIDDKLCDNTCYKSSKIIISNNKHYSSKIKWQRNEPLQRERFEKIIDEELFWEEVNHFKLFNINVS